MGKGGLGEASAAISFYCRRHCLILPCFSGNENSILASKQATTSFIRAFLSNT